ncbi:MAG: hypothetical protein QM736_05800 [Vicinamibacterales bacterium]
MDFTSPTTPTISTNISASRPRRRTLPIADSFGEKPFRERLVDHAYARRAFAVAIVEKTAGAQRNAERLEKFRRHELQSDQRALAQREHGLAIDGAGRRRNAAEWQADAGGGELHLRLRFQAFDHALMKSACCAVVR